MKNTMYGINSTLGMTEEKIRKFEYVAIKIIQNFHRRIKKE
jgi:hypothetical protein